ncbi:MAG: FAD-dependent oxidoreductase [Candidatus Vogelbacteria bacterium]|nr:FAD-dependent oxidoreductase [Candidatus Vogelbacteria bacterium]
MAKKVVIVGGGFGGIQAALDLSVRRSFDLEIVLVSDKPHFEYYPALYRVVAGHSALESCIPLEEIFAGKPVKIVEDRIVAVDLQNKTVQGKRGFRDHFDYLILALGSEAAYFNIPGLAELSFGLKSTYEALQLRKHLELVVAEYAKVEPQNRAGLGQIVVVGGGPAGVELAGELALHTKVLTQKYQLATNPITLDLFEAAPRLLPMLPPAVSQKVEARLHALGVNIFLNRTLMKEEVDEVFLKDMQLKAKTVIWTAGVKPNDFFRKISGLTFDKSGRVIVNDHLQVINFPDVFVIGDGAATPYTGLAQTAIDHAHHVAEFIGTHRTPSYKSKKPAISIPVGAGWAVTIVGGFTFYGRAGWWLRRAADLRYFLSILPLAQTLKVFRAGDQLAQSCPICLPK